MAKDLLNTRCCPFVVGGDAWLEKDGVVFITPLTIDILELVQVTGSINQAAKLIGISYQKAWNIIDIANKNSRLPLIIRIRGGASGGGASVTHEGEKMIREFRLLEKHFENFINEAMTNFNY